MTADSPISAPHALAGELRAIIGKLSRRLREQASLGDLTQSQLAVVRRLELEGPTTVTNLARAEGMRPQSMGANVSVLESAGLLSGAPDPNDGRQTIISLTQACHERLESGRAAREDWLFRAIEANLGVSEQEDLAKATDLLKRLADS